MKVVSIDLDGTLLDKQTHSTHPEIFEAVDEARAAGARILIATGRPIWAIEQPIKDRIRPDGYVTINGQVCFDTEERRIAHFPIPLEVVEAFIRFADAHGLGYGFHMETATVMYVGTFLEARIVNMMGHHGGIVTSEDLKTHTRQFVYNMLAHMPSPQLVETFLAALPEVRADLFDHQCYDVFMGRADKAVGIEVFLEAWDLEWADVLAFGDSTNDVKMLEKAGAGYVVSGGPQAMQTLGLPIVGGPLTPEIARCIRSYIGKA